MEDNKYIPVLTSCGIKLNPPDQSCVMVYKNGRQKDLNKKELDTYFKYIGIDEKQNTRRRS